MTTHTIEGCLQESRLDYMEKWQHDQNGTLTRLEKKLDRLLYAVLGGMSSVVVALIVAVCAGGI